MNEPKNLLFHSVNDSIVTGVKVSRSSFYLTQTLNISHPLIALISHILCIPYIRRPNDPSRYSVGPGNTGGDGSGVLIVR